MVCSGKIIQEGVNSIVDTSPDLSKEWSPSNERGPETYHKANKSWVSWICPTCGGEYNYPINEREVGDESCPYCHKGRALEGYNSLVDTDFELTKEWSPSNERGPETYQKAIITRVLWICPVCGGEYLYRINQREVGDESCPYCHKSRVLEGYNSLVDTDFELSKEWSPFNERSPETYHKMNIVKVLWKCPICGGEYLYFINEREVGDDSCPYCKGIKVLPGYNSFMIKHPDLMKEWDDINNYILFNADHVLDNLVENVWWNCNECNHKYYMSPKQRVYYQKRNMTSCPYCKGLRQKKRHFF